VVGGKNSASKRSDTVNLQGNVEFWRVACLRLLATQFVLAMAIIVNFREGGGLLRIFYPAISLSYCRTRKAILCLSQFTLRITVGI